MIKLTKNKINIDKKKIFKKQYKKKEDNALFLYYKSLNIPKHILNFDEKKRFYIFTIRNLYLSLGELSSEKLEKMKAYYKERSDYEMILRKLEKSIDFTKFPMQHPANYLLFLKLSNTLMYDGKKSIASKHIKKALSILKNKYGIQDPLKFIMHLLYNNLVPTVKSRKLKNKIIGVYLNIYQRIGLSIKIFVKGIRIHKMPLYLAIVKEIFNLFYGDSFLNKNNIKMAQEVQDLKLYKYLNMSDITLFPERMEKEEEDDIFETVTDLDWVNFYKIVQDLRYIILLENIKFEKDILKGLKNYVILKYIIKKENKIFDSVEDFIYDIPPHSEFTYSFLDENYLEKQKKKKGYINLTKKKIKLIEKNKKKYLKIVRLNKKEKLEVLRLKMNYYVGVLKDIIKKKALQETNYEIINIKENLFLTYKKAKFNFIFWEYLCSPKYLHLKIQEKHILDFIQKNQFNYFYFPCFKHELTLRNKNAMKLSDEDIISLFIGENPNLIYLNLKQKEFDDIEEISEYFEDRDIWDNNQDEDDSDIDSESDIESDDFEENISFDDEYDDE